MSTSFKEFESRRAAVIKRYPEDFLRKNYSAWVDYLLEGFVQGAVPIPQVTNVFVTYFDFYSWMAFYDWKFIRNLDVNIRSYRAQREIHLNDVPDEVAVIRRTKTGRALFREIASGQGRILILPFIQWDYYEQGWMKSSAFTIDSQNVGIKHMKYMWGGNGTSGIRGPGFNPDEVLFHELVHGARRLKGIRSMRPVNKGYGNEEEYLAVVITNIYLADKTRRTDWLRSGHDLPPRRLLDPDGFLDNSEGIDYAPRDLIRALRAAQHDFFRDLTKIDAPFNPVQQFKDGR